MSYSSKVYDAPERPTEVTIVAVLDFVSAALLSLAWFQILSVGSFLNIPYKDVTLMYNIYVYTLPILIPIFVITGIGLLQLSNWARVTTIMLSSLAILIDLYGILEVAKLIAQFDWTTFIKMVLEILFIVLLMRPNVVAAFEGGPAIDMAKKPT